MLDLLFRRGNPTNNWNRQPTLRLELDLEQIALNGVAVGQPFDSFSFLGRDEDTAQSRQNLFCYYSLGLEVAAVDGIVEELSMVASDRQGRYCQFPGEVKWHGTKINLANLGLHNFADTFGEWYWIDTDDAESIVFYEFPNCEWQFECNLAGQLERIVIAKTPLLSDIQQRTAYRVTRQWPPE